MCGCIRIRRCCYWRFYLGKRARTHTHMYDEAVVLSACTAHVWYIHVHSELLLGPAPYIPCVHTQTINATPTPPPSLALLLCYSFPLPLCSSRITHIMYGGYQGHPQQQQQQQQQPPHGSYGSPQGPVKWVRASNGFIPPGAVCGGIDKDGQPTFVARQVQ